MNKTFILNDEDDIKDVVSACTALLVFDKKHAVHIHPYKTTISERQRKLYWTWIDLLADFIGEDKDRMHWIYKEKFLVGIFKRREDGEYAGVLDAANKAYSRGDMKEFSILKKFIISKTSIMETLVTEMAEYLTLIDRQAAGELSFNLPHPEDQKLLQYKEAV